MATLAIDNDEVYASLGHLLGISRDPDDWSTETTADVNRIVRSGRRRFFSAHPWRFLNQSHDFITVAPVDSSTITVVDGVVTLAAGSWATDITDYVLAPTDGGIYTIASRDSASQITLHDTSLDLTAGSTYKAYKVKFDMPSGFGGWEGPITVDNQYEVKESRNFPEYLVRSVAGSRRARAGRPELFTVVSNLESTNDIEAGVPSYSLMVYPLPDAVYVLSTRYKVAPGDTLDLANDVPVTHAVFGQAMLEAILSAAEIIAFDNPGVHAQEYQRLIEEAKLIDGRMPGVRYGRPRHLNRGSQDRYRELIDAPVTFEE